MNTLRIRALDNILQDIESFQSIPHTVAEIICTIDDDNTTAVMLAHKIECDLGLLSDILKLVNSTRYTVMGGVTNTKQAVVVLGFNTIRNLACTVGIVSYYRQNSGDSFDFMQFVRHSIGTACCAKVIAKRIKLNPDTAFVSGMLHDIGQLAAAVVFPDEYRMVMDYKKLHDCDIAVAEQAVLGVDHAKLGAHLVGCWNFPPEIGEGIGGHHQMIDDMPNSRMADLLHVAEMLGHALDFGVADKVPFLNDSAMHRLGLSFQQLKPLFEEIEDEYCNIIQMLEWDTNE